MCMGWGSVTHSHPTLFNTVDYSPPGSSVHGISQARILEWVAIPSPADLFNPRIEPVSLALVGGFFTTESPGKESESEVAQLCPTLCGPMDCSLPGSSIHGIFQARVLEWVAISFSGGSSQPRD